MADLTPEMRNAFQNLGVSPSDDWTTVRAAWRAMVRRYHPDQVKGDKAAANRRLAELNAAYDVISQWTSEDAKTFARAAQKRRAEQRAEQRRKEDAVRKAQAAREQDQAAQRATATKSTHRATPNAHAHNKFLDALSRLAPPAAARHSFSF